MAYEQVQTILLHAQTYHTHVGQLYRRLAGEVDNPRAIMLLDSMSDHEMGLAEALADFVREAPKNVMLTWFDSSTDSTSLLETLHPTVDPHAEVEDLIQLGMELDDRLIAIYEDLASRSEPECVRDLFQSLLKQEQQEERLLARQALRCLDI